MILINISNGIWITKANVSFLACVLADLFPFKIVDDAPYNTLFPWLLWYYALVFSFYLFICFFSGFPSFNVFLNVCVSQDCDTWYLAPE